LGDTVGSVTLSLGGRSTTSHRTVPAISSPATTVARMIGQIGLLLLTSTSTDSTWPSGWMISGQDAPSDSTAVALTGRPSWAARSLTS
jgi:hypothetical protein